MQIRLCTLLTASMYGDVGSRLLLVLATELTRFLHLNRAQECVTLGNGLLAVLVLADFAVQTKAWPLASVPVEDGVGGITWNKGGGRPDIITSCCIRQLDVFWSCVGSEDCGLWCLNQLDTFL